MYDVSIRIPLIIYDPKKKGTEVMMSGNMSLNIDLSPTILQYAGIKIPELIKGKV